MVLQKCKVKEFKIFTSKNRLPELSSLSSWRKRRSNFETTVKEFFQLKLKLFNYVFYSAFTRPGNPTI